MRLRSLLALLPALSTAVAMGGPLVGTVLYPLGTPAGFAYSGEGSIAGGQTAGSAYLTLKGSTRHAFIWSAGTGTPVDLNPTVLSGFSSTAAYFTNGTNQVGLGSGTATGNDYHALLWSGTPGSAVDLAPTNLAGLTSSLAYGVSGNQQVGYAFAASASGPFHSIIWHGTGASAQDISPTNLPLINSSSAYATNGTLQVGFGSGPSLAGEHALLWAGTSIATDLTPTNMGAVATSYAYGVGGNQEVGYAEGTGTGGHNHATLWTGSSTAVDLTPTTLAGYTDSEALATNGAVQVGWGSGAVPTNNSDNAMLWLGTPGSAVNLQMLLPAATWSNSQAYSADSSGNIYGIATGTYNGVFSDYAVEWSTAVPEPTFVGPIAIATLITLRRRRPCAKAK